MTSHPHSLRLALSARLNELEGCWLEVTCSGCGSLTQYPLRVMGMRFGVGHRLGTIIPRLTCRRCRAKPASVFLCETHNRQPCMSAPPGWPVQVYSRGE